MKISLQFVALTACLAASASAADLAVLRNGNSIRHERRQVLGALTRLYLSDSSADYIEIPTDQIERFEVDTTPPPLRHTPPPISSATPPTSGLKNPFPQTFTREDLNRAVNGAGERHQIDPDFINSVIRAESGFHPRAVSKKGAQGLMQLMPGTASQLGVKNSFDPGANVEGGTRYLRELLEKYNYDVPKALAAYNAGTKRVDRYRGVPPYFETQTYVARIIRDFNRKKLAEQRAQKNGVQVRQTLKRGDSEKNARGPRPGPSPDAGPDKHVQGAANRASFRPESEKSGTAQAVQLR